MTASHSASPTVVDRRAIEDGRVVDEDVDRSEAIDDGLGQARDRARIREIGRESSAAPPRARMPATTASASAADV